MIRKYPLKVKSNLGLSFARLSLLITMYNTEQWFRYGPPGVVIIIVESHVGLTCASLPYMRFVFEFVSTNTFSKPYGASKDPTKAKRSDPNDGSHPFVELDGHAGKRIQRKTDIEVSTFREAGSDENIETRVERDRAMGEQMRRDERAWSAEEVLLTNRSDVGRSGEAR